MHTETTVRHTKCGRMRGMVVGEGGRSTGVLLYSVIPSTPDFPTEYQIRRNSNPVGLPVFAAILGPGFRASIIIYIVQHV